MVFWLTTIFADIFKIFLFLKFVLYISFNVVSTNESFILNRITVIYELTLSKKKIV